MLKLSSGSVIVCLNFINNKISLAVMNLMGLLSLVLFINRRFSNLFWCWLKN